MGALRKIILSSLLLLPLSAGASEVTDKFCAGLEWGLDERVIRHIHYNYIVDDGPRIDRLDNNYSLRTGSSLGYHIGYNVNERRTVSLVFTWTALGNGRTVHTSSLRETFFFNGREMDGSKIMVQAGLGKNDGFKDKRTLQMQALYGYRYVLTPSLSLDLNAGFQGILDHPKNITDRSGYKIDTDNIRRTDILHLGLKISVAVNFR